MLAVIGEMFEEPNVVGIGMAIRSREDLLSVWNEDNRNDQVQCSIRDGGILCRLSGVYDQVFAVGPASHQRKRKLFNFTTCALFFLADCPVPLCSTRLGFR